MQFGSAALLIGALVGAGADGYLDTKYELDSQGQPRKVSLGFGLAVGGILLGFAGGSFLGKSVASMLLAVGVGAACGEMMKYAANKEAAAMQAAQQSGTQGLLGPANELRQFAPSGLVNESEMLSAFARLQGRAA